MLLFTAHVAIADVQREITFAIADDHDDASETYSLQGPNYY